MRAPDWPPRARQRRNEAMRCPSAAMRFRGRTAGVTQRVHATDVGVPLLGASSTPPLLPECRVSSTLTFTLILIARSSS